MSLISGETSYLHQSGMGNDRAVKNAFPFYTRLGELYIILFFLLSFHIGFWGTGVITSFLSADLGGILPWLVLSLSLSTCLSFFFLGLMSTVFWMVHGHDCFKLVLHCLGLNAHSPTVNSSLESP